MSLLPYLIVAWLLLVGLYGIATSRNLIHLVSAWPSCSRPHMSCC